MGTFRAVLYFQLLWFVSAVGYNSLSLLSMHNGGVGFAGDWGTTISAMGAVCAFGVVTLIGFWRHLWLYKVLSPLVTVMLFLGGVLKHVRLGPETYASEGHWIAAISINVLGAIAFAGGALLSFRSSSDATR